MNMFGTAPGSPVGLNGRRVIRSYSSNDQLERSMITISYPRLYDTTTGRAVLDQDLGDLNRAAMAGFAPGGRRLVSTQQDALVIRDAETGAQVGSAVPVRGNAAGYRYSSDGRRLLVWDSQMYAYIWDTETGQPVARDLRLTEAEGFDGGIGPDSRLTFLRAGNQVRVWDGTTGIPLTPVLVHPATVVSAEFNPDGFHLLTACADGSVRAWPLVAGEPPASVLSHGPQSFVNRAVQFGDDPTSIITRTHITVTGQRGPDSRMLSPAEIILWFGGRPTVLARHWSGELSGNAVASPDGSRVALSDGRGKQTICQLYDAKGHSVCPPFDCGGNSQYGVQMDFSPDSRTLVTSASRPNTTDMNSIDCTLRIWDAATGTPRSEPIEFRNGSQTIATIYARSGELIVASDGKESRVIEVATGRTVPNVLPPGGKLGTWANTQSWYVSMPDGRAFPFDTRTGKSINTEARLPNDMVWDDAAGTLWTLEQRANRRVTQVRDSRTGHPIGPPAELPSVAYSVSWPGRNPNGIRGTSQFTHLLDQATGRPTSVVLRQSPGTFGQWFSRDGRRAVTQIEGKIMGNTGIWFFSNGPLNEPMNAVDVWVWDASTANHGPPYPSIDSVRGPSHGFYGQIINPDGNRLFTRPSLDEVRVIDLSPDNRPVENLTQLVEALSGRRLGTDGNLTTLAADECHRSWSELQRMLPAQTTAPADWHRRRAALAHLAGDAQAAVFHREQQVELTPKDPVAFRALANSHFDNLAFDSAAAAAERATVLDPTNAELSLLRGRFEMERGQWAAAGRYFKQASGQKPPENPQEATNIWRLCLFSTALAGDMAAYHDACSALLTSGTQNVGHPRLVLRWAVLRPGGVSNLAPLIQRTKEAAGTDPAPVAKFNASVLAHAYLRTGQFAEAIEIMDALKLPPEVVSAEDRFVRVIALAKLKRWREARSELIKAREWADKYASGRVVIPATGEFASYTSRLFWVLLREEAEAVVRPSGTDGVAAIREYVAECQKDVDADPKAVGPRTALREALDQLGDALRNEGNTADAEVAFRKALAIREKLSVERPNDPDCIIGYGTACNLIASRTEGRDRAAERLDWYTRTVSVLGPALKAFPKREDARQGLRLAHWGRGTALMDSGKFTEAIAAFDEAMPLSVGLERIDTLSFRMLSRLHAGDTDTALKEADTIARENVAVAPYNAACIYAIAAQKRPDRKAAYSDRAVALLRQAIAIGFNDIKQLKTDSDLDTLRSRKDFQSLLADLEQKFPQPREVAPPPREKK
ncbi:MAG: hypothetical protein U0798_07435 [Gemmataceae bacterium]